MTCCEKCIGVSPIRGVVCNNKLCPCHSKDYGLERVLREFDEFYTLPKMMIPGPQRENAIKKFITQVYKDAYVKGEKEGQARMNNSGRLLFQQGVESERERICNGGLIYASDCDCCKANVKYLTKLKK